MGKTDIGEIIYYGLSALQHRGQESAGIAISNGGELKCYKDLGLVSQVFNEEKVSNMQGEIGIGHVRYSTTGVNNRINAQPILEEFSCGKAAIAHNGNLVNTGELKENLSKDGVSFNTTTDSEVILKLIGKNLDKDIKLNTIVKGVKPVKGAYSFLMLTAHSLIGVRDPLGIRPLCIGKLKQSYIICSESCALSTLGAEFIRDVEPGEAVIVNKKGIESIKFSRGRSLRICAFEYIYFSREDSVIDGVGVYKSRVSAGERLYKEKPVEADIVIAVPESGIPAAIGYSRMSGIPYTVGFVKNRYLGRSFILPSKELRENMVSIKLTSLCAEINGKRVVVVDDSIVRGTTSRRITEVLRRSGAKEIHFRIASPPIEYCCHLGVNTSNRDELITASKGREGMKKYIGADSLEFLSLKGLSHCIDNDNNLCFGCFNGQYPYDKDII
jgi:amidophosphoribosyltransferase